MNILKKASFISMGLAIGKMLVFFFTGSMVVFASAFDSVIDSALSYINHRMRNHAMSGADQEHPFGHYGYEVLTSMVQGLVIGGSGLIIIFECLARLLSTATLIETNMTNLPWAIGMLSFSAFSGLFIHQLLNRHLKGLQAQNIDSRLIESDEAHYLSDFFMNLSSAAGLVLVMWLDAPQLDAVLGLVGGLLVLKTAIPIVRKSLHDILHTSIDPVIQENIANIALDAHEKVVGVHRLRSRTLGSIKFVDFHLKLPHDTRLDEAHDIGEVVKDKIQKTYPDTDINIHLDPDNEPDDDIFKPVFDLTDLD